VANGEQRGPRLTVGLPVYNGAGLVGGTIEAILRQDLDDLELLIADNGSNDETLRVCERAAANDPRVRILRSDQNRGASWNYNRLVREARGEYFKWAPHDDLIGPGYLRRCVEVLDGDPGAVLCHALSANIDLAGNVTKYWDPLPDRAALRPATRLRAVLERPDVCWHVVGVIRREVLLGTAMIAPYSSSDLGLLAELALHGRFRELPEVLSFHRDHPDRSIRRYEHERDRVAWFAPHLEGAVVFPLWRLAAEILRAIRKVPLTTRDRIAAGSVLVPWAWRWRDRLAREAAWGARERWRRRGGRTPQQSRSPARSR
jgi:glycosyltransferase involved in cell wall biosynthesis